VERLPAHFEDGNQESATLRAENRSISNSGVFIFNRNGWRATIPLQKISLSGGPAVIVITSFAGAELASPWRLDRICK
jgi:hypothetical protein